MIAANTDALLSELRDQIGYAWKAMHRARNGLDCGCGTTDCPWSMNDEQQFRHTLRALLDVWWARRRATNG